MAATTETTTFEAVLGNWFPLCYAGILSMGIAYTMQIFGQLELEPASASLIMSLESVFAVVFGAIILHERMTAWEFLGCGLLFVSVILSQLKLPEKVKS